jgi:hypothetical protein
LKYNRNAVIAEIPFDKPDQDHNLVLAGFYTADYCDLNAWTYKLDAQYKVYCPNDNCWGNYDIPGPPPKDVIIYVCGLGRYFEKFAITAPPPEGFSHFTGINYFIKTGSNAGKKSL